MTEVWSKVHWQELIRCVLCMRRNCSVLRTTAAAGGDLGACTRTVTFPSVEKPGEEDWAVVFDNAETYKH